jgi:hypothetical protein
MNLKDNEKRVAFTNILAQVQYICHQNAVEHGFYEHEFNLGEKLMLTITELAEGYEGVRKNIGHLPDEHCPEYTNEEIELADSIIRLLDLAEYRKLRLAGAVLCKMDYNATRPYKHNKQF